MPMRLIARYTKDERVKYISHLDFMRLLQRTLRRADIPVAYSQGFSPHPKLSFASALAVGVTSEGEYMDIYLDKEMDPKLFLTRMNEKLPLGIRFMEAVTLQAKIPSLMSLIERAEYRISLSHKPFWGRNIVELIQKFMSRGEILFTRVNKRGRNQVDIRKMIHNIRLTEQSEEKIVLDVVLSTGSRANLRPEHLIEALFDFINVEPNPELNLGIHRRDLYLNKNGAWISPKGLGGGQEID
ncbi:MAG: DUF2344 domain-containing protein [Clostridiales bacterium]|nr:DUF2344 domain-containing protein [Clostridiales bacterium]